MDEDSRRRATRAVICGIIEKTLDLLNACEPVAINGKMKLVATQDGLISLLDPSLNRLISLFVCKMKHFVRWQTTKKNNKHSRGTADTKSTTCTWTGRWVLEPTRNTCTW